MKGTSRGQIRAKFNKIQSQFGKDLTRRQRQALVALGTANLLALGVLAAFLLRSPASSGNPIFMSPLSPQRVNACRQQISRALLDTGQTGYTEPLVAMVQAQEDGTILLQIQPPPITSSLRLTADAATWAALEAVAAASRSECLDFHTIQVTVILQSQSTLQELYATARVSLTDLLLWSLGEIDDAELTQRLDYNPPVTPTPTFSQL
jgi:hypothetical protein